MELSLRVFLSALLVASTHGQNHQTASKQKSHFYNSDAPHGVSRQYAHFAGPVSGAEYQIVVPAHLAGASAKTSYDFVAKPDYKFGYGVEDSKTGNKQTHHESRDGDMVRGEYTVLEPDGSMRIVQYTADPRNGFQAVVKRAGQAPEVHRATATAAPKGPKAHTSIENYDNYDDYE
ncbi:cuticle protein 7-like [Neocloeon triangulifer]|uniref:cuticle protein 7-like n=1 Tax=Neocloeon triangulifer TaxID=2078957 RepID=UPI00286EC8DF|nr:cuticle protein 7-like [Neocloeon triangulifer]